MVIQWTTPATEELVSAYEYAAAENPAAARRITNHIWETVEVLARHPMAGRKGRIAGTRRESGLKNSNGPRGAWVGQQARKSRTWNRPRTECKGVSATACYRPAAT